MSTHDMLSVVAQELAVLPSGDRRAILQALNGDDRERLCAAMRGGKSADATAARANQSRHSPRIEDLIAAATTGDDARMTGAARAALLDAVGQPRTAGIRPAGRSLMQAAGGLLGQTIAR